MPKSKSLTSKKNNDKEHTGINGKYSEEQWSNWLGQAFYNNREIIAKDITDIDKQIEFLSMDASEMESWLMTPTKKVTFSLFEKINKKNRIINKIFHLLSVKSISTYNIAKCIYPSISKVEFSHNKTKYTMDVKNRIKALGRILKKHNYRITTKSDMFTLNKIDT